MLLSLSPYTFVSLNVIDGYPHSVPGAGLGLAGGFNCFLVLASVYVLGKKYRNAKAEEKEQFHSVMMGIILMFGLVIVTIFLPVLLFKSDAFVPLTPIYTLFFLIMTAYAIIKQHLFNLKILGAEALVTALGVIQLAQILVEKDIAQKIVTGIVLTAVVLLGKFLVGSVKSEVEQRERLEKVTVELQGANDQLKALDQARAEFISIASHQLRTPPATIKWYLSAILSGDYGTLEAEVKTALEKTQRTNNSLISLIEDMLNVSRIERGKMEFLFEKTNLLTLAETTFEQLLPIAHEKKLELLFNRPTNLLPEIMVDKEKLRQVMNNLIDNAIKYTKQGSVLVELFNDGSGNVRFQVSDTGKGVNSLEQNSIFEKYKRGRQSIGESAGLGLGLYVAKIIIGQHKGKIWAESKGEGKGSTFIFTIPVQNNLQETTLVDFSKNVSPVSNKS